MTTKIFGTPIASPDAVALFSRGLDSILAIKIIQQQGLAVQGVHFTTPFYNHDSRNRENDFIRQTWKDYGIPLCVVDLSDPFLAMLGRPIHGYGKNFNPCLDCKLLMMRRARELADRWGASFLLTGEVIGQRPFSQRRDTMRIIERDAGVTGILLRPLSAKLLPVTIPEESGLVQRDKLYDFAGRGRKPQLQLARELGVEKFPTPAGGCLLTDPAFSQRVKTLYDSGHQPAAHEIELLKYGRFYHFSGGEFMVIGRKKSENQELLRLAGKEEIIFRLAHRPGPLGIYTGSRDRLPERAPLLVRHSKARAEASVTISWRQGSRTGEFTLGRESNDQPAFCPPNDHEET